ncbi:hypothetical protein [Aureimonas sp. D3]|uniref:hypothetical protein n=1 Tax=Aureimonas sp. D3 TaxID=1638164 RepID=UPI000784FC0B|nr:hypothetical protein [Aureimonas sp. D3]
MDDEFSREVALMVDEMVNPKKRAAMLASFAREEIAVAKSQNEAILQRTIRKPRLTVDGRRDAPLSSVQPDGTIVAEFNAEANVIRWILRALEQESPRLTGAYKESHTVFADGVEMELGSSDEVPDATEFVIASDLPYAIKLDPKDGLPARSKQAPDGVYEGIAAVAAKRFDGEAKVFFTFRDIPMKGGGMHRNPAIVVRPKR